MGFASTRMEDELLKKIDYCMKEFNYSTKAEFIRESVREKISRLEEKRRKDAQWDKLLAMRGTLKGRGFTEEEFERFREKVGEEYIKELDKKFGIKKN